MKKSKLLILGVIALLLAGGLVLASCDDENACIGGCGKNKDDCYQYCGHERNSCPGKDCAKK